MKLVGGLIFLLQVVVLDGFGDVLLIFIPTFER